MNKSLCIVASTLPITFLAEKASLLEIGEIVTTSDDLCRSYENLNSYSNLDMKIRSTPKGLLFQSLFFLRKIMAAKLCKQEIIFFHECCLPVLDIILYFINPKGHFYPQVSMSGSNLISFDDLPRSKIIRFIEFIGLKYLFKAYCSPGVGGDQAEYNVSIQKYSNGIQTHPIEYPVPDKVDITLCERSILFVIGKSRALDEDQFELYDRIIKIALGMGYRCDIKDHPNKKFHLGYINKSATMLDPQLPSELIDDRYQWVIGTSSTSLLNHGERAISLIDLLKSFNTKDSELIKLHFKNTATDHQINFVTDDKQLSNLLEG